MARRSSTAASLESIANICAACQTHTELPEDAEVLVCFVSSVANMQSACRAVEFLINPDITTATPVSIINDLDVI